MTINLENRIKRTKERNQNTNRAMKQKKKNSHTINKYWLKNKHNGQSLANLIQKGKIVHEKGIRGESTNIQDKK